MRARRNIPSLTDSNRRHKRHPLSASDPDRPVTKVIYQVSALAYVQGVRRMP